ncbi:hypothetical protein ACWCXH_36925 [Kitasatospora sp. NPDC001660]
MLSKARPVGAVVRVVWGQKRLLLVPGAAGVALAGVVGLLVASEMWLWSSARAVWGNVTLGVAGVLVLALVATFFAAVLIVVANDALQGRPVRIGAGYTRATRRLPTIAAWAVASCAVILVGAPLLIGIWWAMAGYFVLPGIALDGLGIRAALRNSRKAYQRDGWESMRSSWWTSLPVVLTLVPSLVVFGVGLSAVDHVFGTLMMAGSVLLLSTATMLSAGLSGVLRTRLYRELRDRDEEGVGRAVLHVSVLEVQTSQG